MISRIHQNQKFRRLIYFFPIQLLLVHLKKNYILLVYWMLLFGFVTNNIADKYGFPHLFLYPEYLDNVSFWSFFLIGFSCGGFIMAFNISSYIMNGFRFPFLATISHPFTKYCLNNSIIPILFLLTYMGFIISFQVEKEYQNWFEVFVYISGFLFGVLLFVFISLTYFITTNKDLFKIFGIKVDDEDDVKPRRSKTKPVKDILHKNVRWSRQSEESREWPVSTYLSTPFKVRLARDCAHYDRRMLGEVFYQNHVNAAYFEVLTIASLLVLGFFREYKFFVIPAGATVFLLFTMFVMLSSAIYSWLRGWSTAIFIGLFLIVNFLSQYNFFSYQNNVYGINYDATKAIYSNETLLAHASDTAQQEIDKQATIAILERWKQKNSKNTIERGKKPKFVMVCTSGGGMRATLWTFHSLQYTDSILNGELLNHVQLMSGSSGGLIGAAYLRELYLRSQINPEINLYNEIYRYKISNDLLNPLSFSIATNDLFLRLQKFKYGLYTYRKDRAYAFERELLDNTDNMMDKRLMDYHGPESTALIPMMVFGPTIINDGRRLLFASQKISYMIDNDPVNDSLKNISLPENIEFSTFFKNQDAENVRFLTTLRMNATFPYILPVTSLPSEPSIEVMDGGIRDNYGIKTAIKFMFVFRDWLSENTSGVVIIQTRDKHKVFEIEENTNRSIISSFTTPLGSFYVNFDKIQNYNHDELLQYASLWYQGPIDIVDFELENEADKKISMSWHLTAKEKVQIFNAINLPENQRAIERLKELIGTGVESREPRVKSQESRVESRESRIKN